MATRSYRDIGALQRKESGSPTARTSYVDVGAAQRQEAAADVTVQAPSVWSGACALVAALVTSATLAVPGAPTRAVAPTTSLRVDVTVSAPWTQALGWAATPSLVSSTVLTQPAGIPAAGYAPAPALNASVSMAAFGVASQAW